MRFLTTFHLLPFLDTVVSYVVAFVLGTLIGAERQYRQRTAGLRTNALVALGSAAFVDLGERLGGDVESIRVIAYVVSGIGFLGAGVIMKEGMNVRGLNTAATLWCSAAVGAIAGSDLIAEAALLAFMVILVNTVLRPLVDAINRVPIEGRSVEATYSVTITTEAEAAGPMGDLLTEHLESAQLPVAELDVVPRGEDRVEIVAKLVSTNVDAKELDALTDHLAAVHGITHATWQARTHD
ncbi:MgtC/SapB family protein [Sphingomonas sp. NFR15]|uniref:MgtC/SapB family protein n=1 Tax=Sphingomonas sp. NFR15 TaxID=1566282 RepID=UPI00088181DB|nr:MgtC/SapB family protein [Sphingomonas sp. NFR15]SDA29811.1 putative Mg2+ transporter-C (MgtC) family protein [Sphingomonas sp. NFR15]